MQVKYDSAKYEIIILLTWAETRQFLSLPAAVEMVRAMIRKAIKAVA